MQGRGFLPLAFVLAAAPALATTGGVCYQIKDVPPGDTLNLRAEPSAKARIVLAVAPGEGIIAKIGPCTDGWCNVSVSTGDGTVRGWMKQRFLRRSECP